MSVRHLALAAALTLPAMSAAALDLADMTDEERAAFRAEVRAYLLENPEVLNEAINETLSRTVMTAFSVLIVLIALYVFGGPVLQPFAAALLVGVILIRRGRSSEEPSLVGGPTAEHAG